MSMKIRNALRAEIIDIVPFTRQFPTTRVEVVNITIPTLGEIDILGTALVTFMFYSTDANTLDTIFNTLYTSPYFYNEEQIVADQRAATFMFPLDIVIDILKEHMV